MPSSQSSSPIPPPLVAEDDLLQTPSQADPSPTPAVPRPLAAQTRSQSQPLTRSTSPLPRAGETGYREALSDRHGRSDTPAVQHPGNLTHRTSSAPVSKTWLSSFNGESRPVIPPITAWQPSSCFHSKPDKRPGEISTSDRRSGSQAVHPFSCKPPSKGHTGIPAALQVKASTIPQDKPGQSSRPQTAGINFYTAPESIDDILCGNNSSSVQFTVFQNSNNPSSLEAVVAKQHDLDKKNKYRVVMETVAVLFLSKYNPNETVELSAEGSDPEMVAIFYAYAEVLKRNNFKVTMGASSILNKQEHLRYIQYLDGSDPHFDFYNIVGQIRNINSQFNKAHLNHNHIVSESFGNLNSLSEINREYTYNTKSFYDRNVPQQQTSSSSSRMR